MLRKNASAVFEVMCALLTPLMPLFMMLVLHSHIPSTVEMLIITTLPSVLNWIETNMDGSNYFMTSLESCLLMVYTLTTVYILTY